MEDEAGDDRWKIRWILCCNATASVGSCKPVQVKGSRLLKILSTASSKKTMIHALFALPMWMLILFVV